MRFRGGRTVASSLSNGGANESATVRREEHFAPKQVEENDHLPAAFQELECLLDADRGRGGRMLSILLT